MASVPWRLFFFVLLAFGVGSAALGYMDSWPINSMVASGLPLLSAFFLFGLALVKAGGERQLRISAVVHCLWPIALVYVLSYWFDGTVDPYTTAWTLITLTALIGATVALGNLADHREGEWLTVWLMQAMLWVGVAYSVLALGQHYGVLASLWGGVEPTHGRLTGPWQQPNLTTSTLWLSAISLMAWRSDRFGAVGWGLLVLFGCVLALAASRLNYPLILFAAGVGVFAAWRGCHDVALLGRRILWSLPVLLVCLLIFPLVNQGIEHVLVDAGWMLPRESVLLIDRHVVDRPRIDEHLKILNAVGDWSLSQWVFGVGPGGYGPFSFDQSVGSDALGSGKAAWLHSHNLFSMIFVETGLLGLGALIGVLLMIFQRLWVLRAHKETWVTGAILGVIFLHSMVEYPLWYPWYLFISVLFLACVFPVHRISLSVRWLMPALGASVLVIVSLITANQLYMADKIISVANSDRPGRSGYQALDVIGPDGLMGSYATLARYRRFGPDQYRLEQQLEEVRHMEQWRPVDLVKAREVTLLLLLERHDKACRAAKRTARRYPYSGPILAEKLARVGGVDMAALNKLMACIEAGLKPWGETLASMERKNRQKLIKNATGY